MRKIGKIGRGLFAVAVLSALSVGVTQAFATPRVEPSRSGYCFPGPCNRSCLNQGLPGGYCTDGYCECYL